MADRERGGVGKGPVRMRGAEVQGDRQLGGSTQEIIQLIRADLIKYENKCEDRQKRYSFPL